MAIRIEKQFSVDAPPDAVWAFLTDPHRVARCLPGASVTEQIDERTYGGKMTVKVGPVSTSYKGKITFERLDPGARTAELSGRGQDVRGRGGADMRMTSRLVEKNGGTDVTVVSEVNVTGILAQFGRGMIEDVSDQMFQTFTEKMRQELAPPAAAPAGAVEGATTAAAVPPEPEEALDVVSLGAKIGSRAVGRLVRRPIFWVGVAVVAALVYLLLAR
ncbi:MAG: SRPBCC family protein [Gemmatimonadetes bacterium]|nr:SRPBCC family protein [Gemmatimonadota bacterium]